VEAPVGSAEWWLTLYEAVKEEYSKDRPPDTDPKAIVRFKEEKVKRLGWDADEIMTFALSLNTLNPNSLLAEMMSDELVVQLCFGIELGIRAERSRQMELMLGG
jgi:hypothetical protein